MNRRAAVLTISDSSYMKMRRDASGPAVRARLEQAGWEVSISEILPDERQMIASRLAELADSGAVSLILSTGGTGVAQRDVTPEAVRDAVDREIPGLGELMRLRGLDSTPLAALSRSTAGTRGQALIVSLPGSPRGAVESLDAILELLPHIVGLLHGETGHPAVGKRERLS
jgi:molybdenum cofactor synthesis domain-containing protein